MAADPCRAAILPRRTRQRRVLLRMRASRYSHALQDEVRYLNRLVSSESSSGAFPPELTLSHAGTYAKHASRFGPGMTTLMQCKSRSLRSTEAKLRWNNRAARFGTLRSDRPMDQWRRGVRVAIMVPFGAVLAFCQILDPVDQFPCATAELIFRPLADRPVARRGGVGTALISPARLSRRPVISLTLPGRRAWSRCRH